MTKCPVSIVKMRTAVAATTLAKTIRKIPSSTARNIAVGGVAYTSTKATKLVKKHFGWKYPSKEWFVATHVPVPLIASMRKACLCTKYGIACTIAGAAAGICT